MRIGFLADIHIKIGQKNVPVEWAKARFTRLWEHVKLHEDKVDIWVIGGDAFDRVPTVEEMEVFFNMVSMFGKPTFIYAGNHEALKKNTTFLSCLKNTVTKLNPYVNIIDDFYTYGDVDFVPYNKLKELETSKYTFNQRILCTHVRGLLPPHVKPEIDLSLLDPWEIVLAGDLHSYENSQRNILYPGSPVTTSFHRNLVSTGFLILDSETLEHDWIQLDMPQLIRKTLKPGDTPVATDYHHTIYEIEGDMSELGEVQDNDLIDKKVVKRVTDTALYLDAEMTMEEEVAEYLRYILQINDDAVDAVLQELASHAGKITKD